MCIFVLMKKEEVEELYNELRKLYTDQEIAESMVLPSVDLTEEEQKIEDAFWKERVRLKQENLNKNKMT